MKITKYLIFVSIISSVAFSAEHPIDEMIDYALLSPNELANQIFKERVLLCQKGIVFPGDERTIYEAAINTSDQKLKALLAIRALETMPSSNTYVDEMKPIAAKLEERFDRDRDSKKLRDWYFDLLNKDREIKVSNQRVDLTR